MSNAFRQQLPGYFLFVIILIGIIERGSTGRFSPDRAANESNVRRYLSFRGRKMVARLSRSEIYDKKSSRLEIGGSFDTRRVLQRGFFSSTAQAVND